MNRLTCRIAVGGTLPSPHPMLKLCSSRGGSSPCDHGPSMEPQPFSWGNRPRPPSSARPRHPFNGAPAFRLGKPGRSGQFAASASSPFNGAPAFRLGKPLGQRGYGRPGPRPSMEPQPFGWGNLNGGIDLLYLHRRPSMEPQPFGWGNSATSWPRQRRRITFNGAPAFRLGKPVDTSMASSHLAALQWSPSLSAGETGQRSDLPGASGIPSMEPQPFGWGNCGLSRRQGQHQGPFNGAPAFRLGKPAQLASCLFPCPSFNGAPAFRLGKPEKSKSSRASAARLQWSPSLSAGETPECQPNVLIWAHPSMEPQPFGWGNPPRCRRDGGASRPSMEPQPFGWGNCNVTNVRRVRVHPSMEPQPFGWGNLVKRFRLFDTGGLPSMEPQPFGWGNFNGRGGPDLRLLPSMEPQPFGWGNKCYRTTLASTLRSFNGAPAFRLGKRGIKTAWFT